MRYLRIISTFVIFAFGCTSQEAELPESISVDLGGWILENVVPQSGIDRTWREVMLEETALTGGPDSLVLYTPGDVYGDENGFSYVVDYGDMRIKKFDSRGHLVVIIGNGPGEGPGEMQNPLGVQVLSNGLIATLDPRPRKLNYFNPDGSFDHSSDLAEPGSFRFVHTERGLKYFMIHTRPLTSLFAIVRDTSILRFPNLPDDSLPTSIHLDGHIVSDGEDIIYLPYHYGLFIRYGESGEQIYTRETVGRRDFGTPTIEKIETPGWPTNYRVTDRPYYNRGITIDDEHLYIHSRNTADSLSEASVIDVYRAQDGDYQYSISLPHQARMSKMYGSYVYSLMDTTVVISKVRIK